MVVDEANGAALFGVGRSSTLIEEGEGLASSASKLVATGVEEPDMAGDRDGWPFGVAEALRWPS